MTVAHIQQPRPPAMAYVKVAVPRGKGSGDEIPYSFKQGGALRTVTLVIPGKTLHEGDTFEVADPATCVTVHGREASMRTAFCSSALNCGQYDEVNCCKEPVSHIARWTCVATSPWCCVGMLVLFLVTLAIMGLTILQINQDGGEFPTFTVQGDLDPDSVYTLQGWAFDEVKVASVASVNLDDTEEASSTEQIQQTEVKGNWGLNIIFRTRGEVGEPGRNLLTRENLEFIKSIQDEIWGSSAVDADDNAVYPAFEDVCLKGAVGGGFGPITNETELECSIPFSPLMYFYGEVDDASPVSMYGNSYIDAFGTPGAIVAQVNASLRLLGITNNTYLSANINAIASGAARAVPGAQSIVFNGRGDSIAACAPVESMVNTFIPQQNDDSSCLGAPYSALAGATFAFAFDPLNAMLATADHEFTPAEVDALVGPLIQAAVPGPPFCSQCYSGACTCDSAADVDEGIDNIVKLVGGVRALKSFFGADFIETNEDGQQSNETALMALFWNFGAPLENFSTADSWENGSFFGPPGNQTAIFTTFASAVYPTLDAYGFNADSPVEIIYFWSVALADITLDLLIHDMILVSGSVAFIFAYMWFHTRSSCLTCMGLVHIFASFPLAFMFYYFVFGIEPFYTLNFLSVYVILAIGADDVFVMVDAWKQYGHLSPAKRMQKAFSRASKAMLITSATTAAAFFTTAASPLLDVSTFGLYTACLVVSNFVSVITYYVSIIMFFHLYCEYACCCFNRCHTAVPARHVCECLCRDRRRQLEMRLEDELYATYVAQTVHDAMVGADEPVRAQLQPGDTAHKRTAVRDVDDDEDPTIAKAHRDEEHDAEMGGGDHPVYTHRPRHTIVALTKLDKQVPKVPVLERFCGDKFFCVIDTAYNRYIFPAVLFALTIGMAYCASQLGPTTQADAFLPAWHPVQRFIDTFTSEFGVSSESDMKQVSVVFGVDPDVPMDRSAFGRFELELGPVQYYDNGAAPCDFGTPEAQQAIYDVCLEFTSAPVWGTNAAGDEEQLVRNPSVLEPGEFGLNTFEVNCWVLPFKGWFEDTYNASFPCELANCTDIFVEFVESTAGSVLPNEDYSDRLLVEGGRLKSTSFAVNSTMGYFSVVYVETNNAKVAWDDYVQRTFAEHPIPCMRSAMHVAEDRDKAWVFLNTQNVLISGAFTGTGTSLAVAFAVLWMSTGNIVVALVATLNIICVTVCILGFMYVLGWELGTIESVSATVLVGLSVDYVVHLAQAYVEAPAIRRRERVRSALFEMGSTVFGGAITSLGASAFLFGCWIQYFFKFGGFMFLTIGLSFLFCFFFFLPLMLVCGPERTVEIDGILYDPASFGCCCKCGGLHADQSEEAKHQRKVQRRSEQGRPPPERKIRLSLKPEGKAEQDAPCVELTEIDAGAGAEPEGAKVNRETVTA